MPLPDKRNGLGGNSEAAPCLTATKPLNCSDSTASQTSTRAAELDTETRDALEIARDLARAGVPIFVARPALDEAGDWMPEGGAGGYLLPKGWHRTTADPATVDAWQPGFALAAVMGHGVDGLDVDPRHGGEQTAAEMTAAGAWPMSLGCQSTPSGGFHDLVNGLGVASKDAVAPGLDVKAGMPDGSGRGFLFLAPTERLSKSTGEIARYLWRQRPMLEELDPTDDSGAVLAQRIRELRAQRDDDGPDMPHEAYEALSEPERARVDRWLAGVVRNTGAELQEALALPEGHTDKRGRGWQKMTADACLRFGQLARADWNGWTKAEARALLGTVVPGEMDRAVGLEATWRDQAGRKDPAPFPAALAPDPLDPALYGTAGDLSPVPVSTVAAVIIDGDKPTVSVAPQSVEAQLISSRIVTGDTFILDAPDHVPAVWGRGTDVLWAQGESLIMAGSPGVGKTTVGGQVLRGRLCGGEVLGLPVAMTSTRVLYLAMDRPRQIARALRRTLGDLPREVLRERLRVWPGPPIADVAKRPETLLGLAQLAGADTVIVDSLKDAAIGLSEDEVGAGYNRARQMCLAEGIEVLELHHLIKRGANGGRPTSLADLYGSTWLSSGAGSVVLLNGDAGDPIVEMLHLKTPVDEVGPWTIIHDHTAGTSSIWQSTDLVMMAKANGLSGLTAKDGARAMFTTENPTPAQVEKARRKLNRLTETGRLELTEGDQATSRPAVWTFMETFTGLVGPVTLHVVDDPSRTADIEHDRPFTDPLTTLTPTPLHTSHPPCKGGEGEDVFCLDCNTPLGELRRVYSDRCADCDRKGPVAGDPSTTTPARSTDLKEPAA